MKLLSCLMAVTLALYSWNLSAQSISNEMPSAEEAKQEIVAISLNKHEQIVNVESGAQGGLVKASSEQIAPAASNTALEANSAVAQVPQTTQGQGSDKGELMSIEIKGVGLNHAIFEDATAQVYIDKINAFIRSLSPTQISQIPPADFVKIPPSGVALLGLAQISAISAAQAQDMSGDQVIQLSSAQIKVLYSTLNEKDFDSIYSRLTKKQIRDFVVILSPKEIGGLSTHQLSKLDLDIFSKLSSQQFKAFSESQISAFTTSQVNSFTDNQLYWSYSKLSNPIQRNNFIRILNKEQLVAIIKFLPKTAYAQVFNSANPRVLLALVNSVNDTEKEYIVSRLNALMISQIYEDLPEPLTEKLTLEQMTFVPDNEANGLVQVKN